jgi:hypothetical protein
MRPSPSLSFLGICIFSGMIGAALLVTDAVHDIQGAKRFVTVRGLAEQEAEADLAVWSLKFRATGNDLVATQQQLDTQRQAVIDFLTQSGFANTEVSIQGVTVADKQANEYNSGNGSDSNRYVLQTSVLLRSTQIAKVVAAQQKTSDLIKSSVSLSSDNYCSNGPSFIYTRLNEVKPAMLAKATQNAREAAGQFAKDAGASVGSIRQASQGYFSITARDKVEENSGGDNGCGASESVDKKIRIVTTIEYYLE